MLNILSLPVGEHDGCSKYRVRKPLEHIKKHTGSDCHIIDSKKDDMNEVVRAVIQADVVMMRPGAEAGMAKIKAIPELSKIKAKWVLDIDDNVDIISPYSEFYRSYGTKEFKHYGEYLWKNGVNGFSTQNNLSRLNSLKLGMRACDLITVTTEKLAEHAREYNKNVYINDNSIDFDNWWRLNNKPNKKLRVIWGGSPSHYEDWYDIKNQFNRLMDEFDFEVILLGSSYMGIFDEKHRKSVTSKPWVVFDGHSYRMMALQGDIGVIPLANLPFNQYKSAIKWYENSAIGMPSIVSNITPYREVIEDGVTAMAYNNPRDFYNKMKLLLTDVKLRQQIGNNAYKWVKKNKDQKTHAIKLLKRLEELCSSK